MLTIDINCDVGEGINNEELLMPYISSCNIACGAHAGDIKTIDRIIKIAQKHQVKIGAHPSFPDRKNFGREIMDISLVKLEISLINQINLMQERLGLFGEKLNHIKAHGALYNLSAVDENIAEVIVNSVKKTVSKAILYVPYNSIVEKLAVKNKLEIKYEAFADRNYNDNLTLVSRTQKNAVITNKEEVINHISNMIINHKVKTISGALIPIKTDTFCVHGDNPEAIKLVMYIYKTLTKKGISIA